MSVVFFLICTAVILTNKLTIKHCKSCSVTQLTFLHECKDFLLHWHIITRNRTVAVLFSQLDGLELTVAHRPRN